MKPYQAISFFTRRGRWTDSLQTISQRQPSWANRRPLLALMEPERFATVLTGDLEESETAEEEDTVGSCEAIRYEDGGGFMKAAYY